MALDKYQTVSQFSESGPWTESTVRWWIFKNVDGFRDRCVRYVGRRLYIDTIEAELWLDQHVPNQSLAQR